MATVSNYLVQFITNQHIHVYHVVSITTRANLHDQTVLDTRILHCICIHETSPVTFLGK